MRGITTDIIGRLEKDCAYVRQTPLPMRVKAVTLPNDDCTFDIYVNSRISTNAQLMALEHELCHIEKDHLYNDIAEIEDIETVANTMAWARLRS